MAIVLRAELAELMLEYIRRGGPADGIVGHPAFCALRRHAEDFKRRALDGREYLDELLKLGGPDLKARIEELRARLSLIQAVDFERVRAQVEAYLPPECALAETGVYPAIGVGGLALEGGVYLDLAPDAPAAQGGAYLDGFALPVLRHELHHMGYCRARRNRPIAELVSLDLLADDYAYQIQLEGGAQACEAQLASGGPAAGEASWLSGALDEALATLARWKSRPDCAPSERDWQAYYALWGERKLAYKLGYLTCASLIDALPVAEQMRLQPREWLMTARRRLDCPR